MRLQQQRRVGYSGEPGTCGGKPGGAGQTTDKNDKNDKTGRTGRTSRWPTRSGPSRRQLRETSQETLAPWDITPAHLRALRVLRRGGTMRLSELSDRLHIAPRSATEVVDALETRGLVQRRPDPGDRRATLAELTEQGATVLEAVRAAARRDRGEPGLRPA